MNSSRKKMGKEVEGVMIPIAPNANEMKPSYFDLIEDIKSSIRKERLTIIISANKSMIILYWKIGKKILEKQNEEGCGTKVIDRLSSDLKEEFPEMKGFSTRNLKYMKKFADCWTDLEIVQRIVAQIPWRSNITLMDKLCDYESRIWYANKLIENG